MITSASLFFFNFYFVFFFLAPQELATSRIRPQISLFRGFPFLVPILVREPASVRESRDNVARSADRTRACTGTGESWSDHVKHQITPNHAEEMIRPRNDRAKAERQETAAHCSHYGVELERLEEWEWEMEMED